MKDRIMSRWTALLTALCLCVPAFCQAGVPADAAAVTGAEPLPALQDILDGDRVWRYIDDPARLAQIQGTEWTEADYDDSGWLMASGAFGVNEGQLDEVEDDEMPAVCLRHYLPYGQSIPTYYFRLPFTADPADVPEPLSAEIVYDDAVIVYLNGREIFAGNTPAEGYPGPNAYGCAEIFTKLPHDTLTIDSSMLQAGENVLCVELHQDSKTSRDIFFSLGGLYVGQPVQGQLRDETLNLGVGADETQMLVTWCGPIQDNACVQVEYGRTVAEGFTDAAVTFPAKGDYKDPDKGIFTYRALLTGLTPGQYIYRVVDADPSRIRSFTVASPEDGFSFLCHGDAQIVDAADAGAMKTYQTLADYAAEGCTPELVLSLGDQINSSGSAAQYRRFTNTPLLKSVPLAVVVGNHETDAWMFSRVFSLPNMDEATEDTSGNMSGDYWFFRGNTLFLCLNSNNEDMQAHRQFLLDARAACEEQYGEPVWTVAAFHHAPFSAGKHANSDTTLRIRAAYPAMLEEAGVDVVFAGHDHAYTRSWPMDGETPLVNGDTGGIVYFTLGSSTGSKYYNDSEGWADYAAFFDQETDPEMARVDVTDSTFTVTTYQMQDDGISVLDAYQIVRD